MVKITLLSDDLVGCVRLQTQASVLSSMYDNATSLFDVSLTGTSPAGGGSDVQPIRAHKAILAHASPHLRDLFTAQGYTDSNKSKYPIANIDHNILCDIVKSIYAVDVELANDDAAQRVRGILIGAKYLVMKDLTDACETFLAGEDQIDVNNCMDVFQFAFKYRCASLLSAVCAFIAKNLVAVSQLTKFLGLSREECTKFLLSDPVVAASADDRWRAAIAWLNHESPSRAESADCIMSMAALDADGVTPGTLLLAAQSAVIRPTIKGACLTLIDALASTVRKHQLEKQAELKAKSFEGVEWYVVGAGRDEKDVYRYDVARRHWSTLPELPWARRGGGACAVGKRLLIVGGYKHNSNTMDIDEFDTVTQAWSTSKARLSTRSGMAVTADAKYAYALGGLHTNGRTMIDTAERYYVQTQTIEKLADMSIARFGATAVSKHDEVMFVVGGRVAENAVTSRCCDAVDKYDHASSAWSTIATLRFDVSAVSAAAFLSDDLYMDGDCFLGSQTFGILDTRTGQQRATPELIHARRGCSAVALDNNVICVLGGYETSFGRNSASVEALDVREGRWTTGNIVPDMPGASAYFSFARVLP